MSARTRRFLVMHTCRTPKGPIPAGTVLKVKSEPPRWMMSLYGDRFLIELP